MSNEERELLADHVYVQMDGDLLLLTWDSGAGSTMKFWLTREAYLALQDFQGREFWLSFRHPGRMVEAFRRDSKRVCGPERDRVVSGDQERRYGP
jgi:hypothetical protein